MWDLAGGMYSKWTTGKIFLSIKVPAMHGNYVLML